MPQVRGQRSGQEGEQGTDWCAEETASSCELHIIRSKFPPRDLDPGEGGEMEGGDLTFQEGPSGPLPVFTDLK